ncbi:MAG: MAPEG family protein [Pseudomonadota bacterium]
MEAAAIVTILIVLQTFWFAVEVGKARQKFGVPAPACSGSEGFERAYRVHQNSIEQMVLLLPSMWVFATFVNGDIAAALGVVYLIGRQLYRSAYVAEPRSRSTGFAIGALSLAVLALGGLAGAAVRLVG